VQLTTTGTPAKPWLGVAQAPDGRTAAVYNNDPSGNANSRLQWFKVWDRNGNEIKDLPLQSKNVGNFVNRPLAFEISDDGPGMSCQQDGGHGLVGWFVPVMARAGFDRDPHHLDLTLIGHAAGDERHLALATSQSGGIARTGIVGDAIATWRGRALGSMTGGRAPDG